MDGIDYCEECEKEHRKEVKKLIDQLKRKEQECEEHRRNAESYCKSYQYSCAVNGKITDRALKYKQALDEIKSICLEDVHTFADGTELRYDSLDEILDIINKAKGEDNAIRKYER